jgi:hypothetical protein
MMAGSPSDVRTDGGKDIEKQKIDAKMTRKKYRLDFILFVSRASLF